MPLTKQEKRLQRKIVREYERKGFSKKRSQKIANAVVYQRKRLEEM